MLMDFSLRLEPWTMSKTYTYSGINCHHHLYSQVNKRGYQGYIESQLTRTDKRQPIIYHQQNRDLRTIKSIFHTKKKLAAPSIEKQLKRFYVQSIKKTLKRQNCIKQT